MSKYEVGQTVIVTDVNVKGHREATVTKVGTKLVYVSRDAWGRENASYRIADGARNDNYRHSHIYTVDEYNEIQTRAELISALKEEGVVFERSAFIPTSRLEKILEAFQ